MATQSLSLAEEGEVFSQRVESGDRGRRDVASQKEEERETACSRAATYAEIAAEKKSQQSWWVA